MDVEIIRSGKRMKTISAREVDGVIAHLKVPGHGPEFWKTCKRYLKQSELGVFDGCWDD